MTSRAPSAILPSVERGHAVIMGHTGLPSARVPHCRMQPIGLHCQGGSIMGMGVFTAGPTVSVDPAVLAIHPPQHNCPPSLGYLTVRAQWPDQQWLGLQAGRVCSNNHVGLACFASAHGTLRRTTRWPEAPPAN